MNPIKFEDFMLTGWRQNIWFSNDPELVQRNTHGYSVATLQPPSAAQERRHNKIGISEPFAWSTSGMQCKGSLLWDLIWQLARVNEKAFRNVVIEIQLKKKDQPWLVSFIIQCNYLFQALVQFY